MGTATITPNPSSGSHPPLPPELLDYVLGFLHDDRETLERCCLVSTSWIPRTRNYLFSTVDFGSAADLERWKRAFPDTSNSPAHHTHSLFVSCVEVVTVADADEGGWVRAFSRVTRLAVHTFSANFNHPTVSLINLVCHVRFIRCARIVYVPDPLLTIVVGEPGPVPIDLSRATKLRDASFQILLLGVGWIAQALKTITHHHREDILHHV